MLNLRSPGLWLFLGGLEILFLVHLAEFMYPGYSVSKDYISKLGVGPTDVKAVFMAALLLFGAIALLTAYLLRQRSKKPLVWLFLALSGIGAIGVAIFDMNAFSEVHAAFAVTAFLFGNLAVIVSSKMVRPPLSWLFVILGLIGLVALPLMGTDTDLGLGIGGMERLIFYPPMFWALGFGGYLLAEERPAP